MLTCIDEKVRQCPARRLDLVFLVATGFDERARSGVRHEDLTRLPKRWTLSICHAAHPNSFGPRELAGRGTGWSSSLLPARLPSRAAQGKGREAVIAKPARHRGGRTRPANRSLDGGVLGLGELQGHDLLPCCSSKGWPSNLRLRLALDALRRLSAHAVRPRSIVTVVAVFPKQPWRKFRLTCTFHPSIILGASIIARESTVSTCLRKGEQDDLHRDGCV